MKRRFLVVAEAVTLAHVGRPLALAKVLEQLGHEVVVACASGGSHWVKTERQTCEPIWSISSAQFIESLSRGATLYNRATLIRYVEEDLALIDRVRPDVIIGDFRLSLYISGRLRKRPYGALANAYWSPRYFELPQVPEIPLTRLFGVTVADRLFRIAHRAAFRWQAQPFIETCRRFGVAPPGDSILEMYTASDCTAFADAAEFYTPRGPAPRSPEHEREAFVGPLHWSPTVALPPRHEQWGKDRPLVYVTMGSSGHPQTAERILHALDDVPVDVVIAKAGAQFANIPDNAIALDFVPGDALCHRSALVIGNGGSPIAYQALRAGVPLLGLASNLDQFLNMRMIERISAGKCLRSSRASARHIRESATMMLDQHHFHRAAAQARQTLSGYEGPARLQNWLSHLVS